MYEKHSLVLPVHGAKPQVLPAVVQQPHLYLDLILLLLRHLPLSYQVVALLQHITNAALVFG